mmetsp:Transcript_19541/g.27528  ORF Transcript_19541/g.27528 Transcript_19541/m.27528 type:complete len:171 (+) Transcript_19541:138-650(+)|eukprot:CAMPEP_0185259526 /NCGR_PEP_ID=MMETSP1359-20130426/8279_1 /TAXON_ID=552665 /ORGANISM="Bigelowiella longifila, Strain CCMP242" /LENGTH=170 /DNA_ID=CAMNT_0027845457 /DNA_START=123 /DNA_END=635 /DNA_ORIENTATION=-
MSYLDGQETKLLMRILERCVEDRTNPKWRSINLSKVKGKLSDTSLVILQQAGFQRTESHMVLPMTPSHNNRARAVYTACIESISFTPGERGSKTEDSKSSTKTEGKSLDEGSRAFMRPAPRTPGSFKKPAPRNPNSKNSAPSYTDPSNTNPSTDGKNDKVPGSNSASLSE